MPMMGNDASAVPGPESGTVVWLTTQVSRRNKRKDKVFVNNAIVRSKWDSDKTVTENYKNLGLVRATNIAINSSQSKADRKKSRQAAAASSDGVTTITLQPGQKLQDLNIVAELEKQAKRKKPLRFRSLSAQQFRDMHAFVKKHGDDVAKMARDMRLNRWQKTATQLAKSLAIYNEMFERVLDDRFGGMDLYTTNEVRLIAGKEPLTNREHRAISKANYRAQIARMDAEEAAAEAAAAAVSDYDESSEDDGEESE
ncbi:uncharacterized protein AMSG_09848 [Thecamonas trahens ATCC 50062]|uniref:Nucleolar protein 16 n=1 Tax=Thecamonas trahens ATCC 50062 TaxID=461836 RepID=A0A0L0DNJ7_THETB|nr:hypothetical protein AMSG_09848 [Thecamonas trahens ATCC 50062]KNC53889.1 hypothetical protein AMSG_09848 [Thecamonas trahens ATCC 50062]|eukprot:XP_013754265.1 hypothetical protein AMSG_09848 [Thecamonas trahens ATCC 50062]